MNNQIFKKQIVTYLTEESEKFAYKYIIGEFTKIDNNLCLGQFENTYQYN